MEQKNLSIFNKDLENDIINYCKLNNIEDIEKFKIDCFKKGYNIEKYGLLGEIDETKIIEKEIIKEVVVEKPIEVVKEVISYVEKPIEIIKEVIVEKPVEVIVTKTEYISDDTKTNELLLKIQQLENEKNELSLRLQQLYEEQQNIKNNDKSKLLEETLYKLRVELSEKNKKIKELEEQVKQLGETIRNKLATFHPGSNLRDKL